MRLAAIASALAIVLCVAVFGAILSQKASLPVPAPAPPQATPTDGRAPGSVVTVADSAPERSPMPAAMPTSCSNPNALGVSRVVEIDTTGGPGFGFEHFKSHDFLREGEVVLTFDDGPWPKNTPAVLAALAAHCTKAIFSADMDSFDFKMRKPEQVRQSVMEKLKKHGKGIVLVHDFQRATAEAAMDLLNDLKAGGYKIVFMQPKFAVTTIASYDEAI